MKTRPGKQAVMWPQVGNDTPCVGVVCETELGTPVTEDGLFVQVAHSHTREREFVPMHDLKIYHPFHKDHGQPWEMK